MDPIKFTIVSKHASSKSINKKPQEEEPKDYVKGFSGGDLLSVNPQQTKNGPFVIPLEMQGHTKRSKPSSTLKAEDTKPTENGIKSEDQIAVDELVKEAKNESNPSEAGVRTVPLTVQNQIEGMEGITDDDARFKFDLESRPEEADEEAYEEMPIDEFGFAMLRGMGWAPGTQIGLNNRGLAEPIEFVKRPGYRLGLGATPKDLPVKKKKYIKPGESRDPPPVMVAQTGPDGKVRHVKPISEKLVPLKKGLQTGQLVGIVSGPHEGLYARIVSTGDDEDVVVRLESSSEDLVVPKSDVSIVDLALLSEGHPALKFMIKEKRKREREQDEREEKESASYHKKESDRDEPSNKHSSSSSKKSSKSSKSDSSSAGNSWLRPRIRVRVVSKSFQNGKHYNKVVTICDVVGYNECSVLLDNGLLVEGVKQRMLETVIPRVGGKVMVVEGENKGKVGKLLERMKKGSAERAIVQMIGDLSIQTFSLDDVAQYEGTYDEEAVDISV